MNFWPLPRNLYFVSITADVSFPFLYLALTSITQIPRNFNNTLCKHVTGFHRCCGGAPARPLIPYHSDKAQQTGSTRLFFYPPFPDTGTTERHSCTLNCSSCPVTSFHFLSKVGRLGTTSEVPVASNCPSYVFLFHFRLCDMMFWLSCMLSFRITHCPYFCICSPEVAQVELPLLWDSGNWLLAVTPVSYIRP